MSRFIVQLVEKLNFFKKIGLKKRKSYLFQLSYGNRRSEVKFLNEFLEEFNTRVSRIILIINNNPYNLELFLYIDCTLTIDNIEIWMQNNYSQERRRLKEYFGDVVFDIEEKGYLGLEVTDSAILEQIIVPEKSNLFNFPDKATMEAIWPLGAVSTNYTVFLCYSGKDRLIINEIFDDFQKSEIPCFYAEYEIQAGDSIVKKIDEGLKKSNLCIVFLSNNFINPETGWPESELNYFVNAKRTNGVKDIIYVNIGLDIFDNLNIFDGITKLYDYNNEKDELLSLIAQKSNGSS